MNQQISQRARELYQAAIVRDNAVVESFFGTLKSERVFWQDYQTRQQARNDVVDYIAMFYNPLRLHSYLDYKSPDQYEWTAQWAKVA